MKVDKKIWEVAQKEEAKYWNNNHVLWIEEAKQYAYFDKLGIFNKEILDDDGTKLRVLDIGGGYCSFLLKYNQRKNKSVVVDPLLKYAPRWVLRRYEEEKIEAIGVEVEDYTPGLPDKCFDEVWIYNVLQHTVNPEYIAMEALRVGFRVRVFEPLNIPTDKLHLHTLTAEDMTRWFGGSGMVEKVTTQFYNALSFYGSFYK